MFFGSLTSWMWRGAVPREECCGRRRSDAGYFEVPNTGQTAAIPNDALFPGFCTGGGLIHLVWLQNDLNTPVATLNYATGVLA